MKSSRPTHVGLLSLSKNMFFDRLAEVKEAVETNNSNLSAYIGTVRFELCSKSKHLAKQAFTLQKNGLSRR